MSRPLSIWTEGIIKFLGDGEEHTLDEVVDVCRHLIPPGVAYRRSSNRTAKEAGDQHSAIISGQRKLIRESIASLKSSGKVEYDGTRVRMLVAPPSTISSTVEIAVEKEKKRRSRSGSGWTKMFNQRLFDLLSDHEWHQRDTDDPFKKRSTVDYVVWLTVPEEVILNELRAIWNDNRRKEAVKAGQVYQPCEPPADHLTSERIDGYRRRLIHRQLRALERKGRIVTDEFESPNGGRSINAVKLP